MSTRTSAARRVFTESKQSLTLGKALARGGEAVVYRVQGKPGLLAKLYLRPRPEMREKLAIMRAAPPEDPARAVGHASIAWPEELLLDRRGACMGYTMPFVKNAVPAIEVFNPRRRAKVLPGFDARYLHRTARNLASSLTALHQRDYVVGDLSERNVLVTPRTLITLIDADSFQVQSARGGRIEVFPCPVGRSEYTPPELQGRAFKGILRRPEHDRFGLAVLIYQLLMGGSHPFRGRWVGQGAPPTLEEKIAAGRFPWAEAEGSELEPPPVGPDLADLHPELQEAFLRCFADGHANPSLRPSADEWAQALDVAEASLSACGQGHVFSDHLKRCPDCGGRGSRRRAASMQASQARAGASGQPGILGRAGGRVAAELAPAGQAVAGTLDMGQRIGSGLAEIGRWPLRVVAGMVGAAPPGRSMLDRGRDLRLAAQRAAGLAVLAAIVAGVSALAVGVLQELIRVPLSEAQPGRLADSLHSAGLWAILAGGAGLAAASGYRHAASAAADGRPMLELLQPAGIESAKALAGWAVAWFGLALLFSISSRLYIGSALLGAMAPDAPGPAWGIGWMLYGTLVALSAGLGRSGTSQPRLGSFATSFVGGATGWMLLRLLGSLAAW